MLLDYQSVEKHGLYNHESEDISEAIGIDKERMEYVIQHVNSILSTKPGVSQLTEALEKLDITKRELASICASIYGNLLEARVETIQQSPVQALAKLFQMFGKENPGDKKGTE